MSDSLWDHIEVTAVPFLHIVGEEPIDPALTPGFDYVQSYEWIHPQIATGGAIRWHSGLDQLQRKGVTAIVSGRSDFDDRLLAEGHEIGMDFLYNPTADDGNVKPATWFKAAIDFCMPHLHRGERVFLHCHGGVNRGPSMAYAVLRAYTGWDHERAFHAIVSVRSIAFVSYAYDADLALHNLGYTSHTTPGLARTYKHPGDESLVASRTSARRDNLTTDDAPRQQPMKANIKPAQRKKPSADQKKYRRAQTRKHSTIDGCPECGSTDATPDENHKDEYRCNYCGTVYQPGTGHIVSSISAPSTTHPAKEASMTSNPTPDRPTEADLLTRLATATTLADQTRIAEQIEDLRAGARDTVSYLGSLDWDAMTAPSPTWAETLGTHLSPIHEGSLHTGHGLSDATDWMDDLVPTSLDDSEMTARMRSQATLWYTTEVWAPVKDDPSEFAVQSRNAAVRAGAVAGLQREAATSVFLDQVRHLASRDGLVTTLQREGEWGTDPMRPGPDPTVPTYVSDGRDSLPVGVDPAKAETHDDGPDSEGKDPKTKTDAGVQQSLSEGSPPEGDHSESIENPLTGDTTLDKSKGEYGTDKTDRMNTQSAAAPTHAKCSKCGQHLTASGPDSPWNGTDGTSSCPKGGHHDGWPEEWTNKSAARYHLAGDNHTACPIYPGQSYNTSSGDCSCGSNHRRWANPNNPGGMRPKPVSNPNRSQVANRRTAAKMKCSCGFSTADTRAWQDHIFAGPDTNRFRRGHERVSSVTAAPRGNSFSISDAKNEEGEWTMSPEQIQSEMLHGNDPMDPDDYYDREAALHRIAAEGSRPLYEIAEEIRRVWRPVFFGAVPYLDAMSQMSSINDRFYEDSGQTVVAYFLSNTKTWRGDDARRIKAELRAMQTRRSGSLTADKVPGQPDVVRCSNCNKHNTVHAGGRASEEKCVFCGTSLGSAKVVASHEAGSVNDLTGIGTCSVCGDSITRDPKGESPRTWHHDNGSSHDHEAKPGKTSAKYAISLTQVGVDPATGNGQGTTSDGHRVTFRLTDQERKDLKAVLYSDLAVNFSGVDVDPSDIIDLVAFEQGVGHLTGSLLDIDARLAEVFSRPYGGIETYSTQTYADVLRSDRGLGEGINEGDSPEGDHSESATQEPGQGANDASTGTDADRPDGGINWGAGGGAAKDQTGAYTSSLSGSLSENLTGNARVFVATLEQMSSLDDEIDGITGHQVAHLLAREPGIPDSLREALRGGDNPFAEGPSETRREGADKPSVCHWCQGYGECKWCHGAGRPSKASAKQGGSFRDFMNEVTDTGTCKHCGKEIEKVGVWQTRDGGPTRDICLANKGTRTQYGGSHVPTKKKVSKQAATEGPWKAQVTGIGENVWSENALRFQTQEEAQAYISDLSMRWFGFDMGRVVPSDTPNREPVDPSDPRITHNFRTGSRREGISEKDLPSIAPRDEERCTATDKHGGQCVYGKGHLGRGWHHRFLGGDEDARYDEAVREFKKEKKGSRTAATECEYCGEKGHDYTRHPEAVADAKAWERERNREEFPFGDYHESGLLATVAANIDTVTKQSSEKCWDCGGTGAVPMGGGEDPEDVDNGYVRCSTCHGTGKTG